VMAPLNRIVEGIRALFHRKQLEREMDEELRAYLVTAVDRKMAAGMSHQDAMRAARVEMGGVEAVKEQIRDVGWESLLESFWQDVRHAVRMLRKSPGFTLVAVLSLALGIGATTAIFSLLNALIFRPLAVSNPDELVELKARGPRGALISFPMYRDLRAAQQVFTDIA